MRRSDIQMSMPMHEHLFTIKTDYLKITSHSSEVSSIVEIA